METVGKGSPRAYALYTFIDAETAKNYGEKQYTLEPQLRLKLKALSNLIEYAYKNCCGIETRGSEIIKLSNGGRGRYGGICFATAMCVRIVCVAVSVDPIGVSMQVPFSGGEDDFASQMFTRNEYAEYKRREHGDDTLYYIKCKKFAYKKMLGEDSVTTVDSTEHDAFTLHKDVFPGETTSEKYFFAATGNVEFIKVDIKDILP